MDGYQVAVASPGVTADEAKQLAVWGPAHDSLLDTRVHAQSVNFHPLTSGRYCVSLSTALDAEYSGRGGCQIYTHSLLVSRETFRRFANDAFRLLEAALAGGRLTIGAALPERLESFGLIGAAGALNAALVTRLARDPGATIIARFVDAALKHRTIAVKSNSPLRWLCAGLLNLLPVECRCEVSFSTGLRVSPRRAFRISALSEDSEEQRRTTHGAGALAVDLTEPAEIPMELGGWSQFLFEMLSERRFSQLAAVLSEPQPGLTLEGLSALADSLSSPTRVSMATVN